MLLHGWTQVPPAEKDDNKLNGETTQNTAQEGEMDSELEEVSEPSGKKRKLSDVSDTTGTLDASKLTAESKNHKEVEKLDDEDDDDDDLVMIEDPNLVANKKVRLQ